MHKRLSKKLTEAQKRALHMLVDAGGVMPAPDAVAQGLHHSTAVSLEGRGFVARTCVPHPDVLGRARVFLIITPEGLQAVDRVLVAR